MNLPINESVKRYENLIQIVENYNRFCCLSFLKKNNYYIPKEITIENTFQKKIQKDTIKIDSEKEKKMDFTKEKSKSVFENFDELKQQGKLFKIIRKCNQGKGVKKRIHKNFQKKNGLYLREFIKNSEKKCVRVGKMHQAEIPELESYNGERYLEKIKKNIVWKRDYNEIVEKYYNQSSNLEEILLNFFNVCLNRTNKTFNKTFNKTPCLKTRQKSYFKD